MAITPQKPYGSFLQFTGDMVNQQAGPQIGAAAPIPAAPPPAQPQPPATGVQAQPITQQNTTAYTSYAPQPTAQQQMVAGYQSQLAGQVAQTPQYNYQGVGQNLQDAGTQALMAALTGLSGGAGNYTPGMVSAGGPGGDTTEMRKRLMEREAALSGPDRAALANQAFELMREQSDPDYQMELRNVGRKASALGRIGAGMTTNDLTGVQQSRDRMLSQAQRALAMDAAGQQLQDRLGILQGTQGVFGTMNNADQGWGQLGLQAGIANEGNKLNAARMGLDKLGMLSDLGMRGIGVAQGLRGEQFGYDQARYGAGLQGLGAINNLSGQLYGQAAGDRNELRGERDYQYGLDRQAQEDWIRQQALEEQLYGNQFGRDMGQFNAFAGYGFGGGPEGTLLNNANAYENQAGDAYSGAGDLLSQALYGGVPLGGYFGNRRKGGSSGSVGGIGSGGGYDPLDPEGDG